MLSGRRLDLLDPSPLDVEIEDIAHGLARVGRWNGQTAGGHVFSVAQHSLFVEAIAAEMAPGLADPGRLAVLLHDAAEYVIGDIITPLKSVIGDGYAAVEARLRAAIHLRVGLAATPARDIARLIKRADKVAAYLEATELAGFSRAEADEIFGRPEMRPAELAAYLAPWPTDEAQSRFLRRFRELSAARSF
ncbi:HD family hydrolase [Enterovirga sp. DB1703]|uniref:HD family hydrolase n=2 Tax=Enterovirga aerilata TaxID=2730920 RepID=A0A849IF43_9HYPH|nr:HD family hydrolase [Enterovirga sp. DB1703]NNM74845.1 HD family hydrolase [Enterovirga sp. DB1703]